MSRPRKLRKLIPSQNALQQRNRTLAFGIAVALGVAGALALLLAGCGPGAAVPTPTPPPPVVTAIQAADIDSIVNAAVGSINVDMTVAVVDRAGFILGVFRTQNAPTTTIGNFGMTQNADDVAVALARTGAFFSNDEA